jgi:glycerophosphoryl diester phosphodiesterase
VSAANPGSLLQAGARIVALTTHRALWSGSHRENSLEAIRECYRERVARLEIDIRLQRGEFVVTHDEPRRGARLPALREVLAIARDDRGPTLLELDAKDDVPWPWPSVEHLVRLVREVRERVVVTSCADWNLRRLQRVDAAVPVGFDPQYYLDWTPRARSTRRSGAYGYLDTNPLARRRTLPPVEYLRERLEVLVRLVPRVRELHLRLAFFERMLDDGLDPAALVHEAGALVDVWTLNAGTRGWRARLARAVAAGVDIVTTDTPQELAEAWRSHAA